MLGENTWQRLDRAARHSTPGIVTVALTLVAVVPMQMPHFGPIAPLVPLMAIYYWAIHRPDLAQNQLDEIAARAGTGGYEYTQLAEKIAAYKAG